MYAQSTDVAFFGGKSDIHFRPLGRIERDAAVGNGEDICLIFGIGCRKFYILDHHLSGRVFGISVKHDVAYGFLHREVQRFVQLFRNVQTVNPFCERGYLLYVVAQDEGRCLVADGKHRQVVALLRTVHKRLHICLHTFDDFARTAVGHGGESLHHPLLAVLHMVAVLRLGQTIGVEEQHVVICHLGGLSLKREIQLNT